MRLATPALALCAAAALTACAGPEPAPERPHHSYRPHPAPGNSVGRGAPAATTSTATTDAANAGVAPAASPDQDGPPSAEEIPADLSKIADAVPQAEPRSGSGNPEFYDVYGDRYYVRRDSRGFKERGVASWYGSKFQGKHTSSGEPYDMFRMTAAHKTLPIPCYVRVTNLRNGTSAVVRVNDRGPFHPGRIIDLSYAAALKLGVVGEGSAPVEIETVEPAMNRPAPTAPPVNLAAAPAVTLPVHAQMSALPDPSAPRVTLPRTAPATSTAGAPVSPPMPAPAAAMPAGPPHYLQAGLFEDPVNAVSLRDQLNGLGILNVLLKSETRGEAYIHRVLIGPFADAQALDAARKHLADLKLLAVPVVE